MISWFVGLFYLPRLFVHHAMSLDQPVLDEKFKEMERKLYYFVTPWMILTLVFGTWMLLAGAWTAYGSMMSHKWYRWFNEFPLLLLVAIVLLAVFKPF